MARAVLLIEPLASASGLRLFGEVVLETAPQLEAALEPLVDGGTEDVTLELSGLQVLDSSGIRVIAVAARRISPRDLLLLWPSPHVLKVIRLAGVHLVGNVVLMRDVTDLERMVKEISVESREALLTVITSHPSFRAQVINRLSRDPEKLEWAELIEAVHHDDGARDALVAILEAVRHRNGHHGPAPNGGRGK
ncbi:MAG: STAS domain-containing protein [Actinobacteria bacterium]|nr:STAS domain-containing protein [Actinomycetota bacterium]